MSETVTRDLPSALADIVDEFHALAVPDRLQLLLEFSRELPALPERYVDHPELLEPVPECQSPIFLATEVTGSTREATVRLYFSAPPEAPTTRGFAGILREGLDGLSVQEVLAVPSDLPHRLALAEAVSPLRLNGMSGMLERIKRQVRHQVAA
ncbi:MAG: SufE family protein [Nocardioidaceae bacterium]